MEQSRDEWSADQGFYTAVDEYENQVCSIETFSSPEANPNLPTKITARKNVWKYW